MWDTIDDVGCGGWDAGVMRCDAMRCDAKNGERDRERDRSRSDSIFDFQFSIFG